MTKLALTIEASTSVHNSYDAATPVAHKLYALH